MTTYWAAGFSLPAGPAELVRLDRFRASHPEWSVAQGDGFWQAFRRDEPGGATVVTRYELAALLDALEAEVPP